MEQREGELYCWTTTTTTKSKITNLFWPWQLAVLEVVVIVYLEGRGIRWDDRNFRTNKNKNHGDRACMHLNMDSHIHTYNLSKSLQEESKHASRDHLTGFQNSQQKISVQYCIFLERDTLPIYVFVLSSVPN